MLAQLAREAVGEEKSSQQAFADLIGVSMSAVTKRELGALAVAGTTATLYTVLAELGRIGGLGGRIRAALESVPKNMRSEGAALIVLDRMARAAGFGDLVERVLADSIGGELDDVHDGSDELEVGDVKDQSIASTMRLLGSADKAMARRFLKASPSARPEWGEARRLFAQAMKQLEIAMETDAAEKQAPRDDGGGGG